MLARVEEDAGPRQKDERGRAEVGDPAREEDSGRRPTCRNAGKHTDVINCHQDHHRAADKIDRSDAGL